ncbi:MAG: radical SAM protein [Candidatus Methanoperedens sp.]|nr:radical SAM protein [Candidatus Methanoperedens sp.]
MKLTNEKEGFIKLRSPAYINLDLTNRCNWNCKFCSTIMDFERSSFQPFSKFKRIIDKLSEAEVFEINLFGGEPFIHPDVLAIVKYLHDSGFEISFVSNGSTLNKPLVDKIVNYINAGSISIHGFKDTHENITGVENSFDSAILALDILSDAGLNTGLCYTLVNENFRELRNFSEHILDNFNINYLGVNRFVPQGRGIKARKQLELSVSDFNEALLILYDLRNRYKKRIEITDGFPFCLTKQDYLENIIKPCTAGVSFGSVNEYGDVKICSASKHCLGNIFKTSLEEIWQNSQMLTEYRSLNWLDNSCKACDKFNRCLSGCKVTQNKPFSSDILLKEYGDNAKAHSIKKS